MAPFTQDIASWVEVSVHAFLWLIDGSSSSSFDVLPLLASSGDGARDDDLQYPATS